MTTPITNEKYVDAYQKFTNPPNTGGEKKPACQQLREYRSLLIFLKQERNTYWPRPCWRDWPCIWTQHRTEIDKLIELLYPIGQDLERECLIETNVKIAAKATEDAIRRTLGDQKTTADSKSTSDSSAKANANPVIAQRDINHIQHLSVTTAGVQKV